ncbi:UPF0481 protein At3g47200-like [Abrus precatorius]|uniref:UPF0481 protein At3g47200-like n=1 Tax=Abrus precatorius TaxID=3816 RepID=A0A8B8K0Y6_ABRPR|nr:UPF0481 protein At3g47200-like [Abrus precatorius]
MMPEAADFDEAQSRWEQTVRLLKHPEDISMIIDEESKPMIQRVPGNLRGRVELEKFYLPNLISIGPIHFLKPYVKRGELYKVVWTAMYLNNTNQTYDYLCEIIRNSFHEHLAGLFTEECWKYDDAHDLRRSLHVEEMLVVDGCSVLHVLDKSVDSDYPDKELKVNVDQLVRVHHDLLLLENQIPYQVLKLLCNDKSRRKRCMHNFLLVHGIGQASKRNGGEMSQEHYITVQENEQDEEEPVHLLDYLRRALLRRDRNQVNKEIKMKQKCLHLRKYRIGTVRELKVAGIRITKCSNSFSPCFIDGKLQLPDIVVDGSTALISLNLIAYEMCPDFGNNFEITSLIVFLSSLIEQPEDVKELRRAGVLCNQLASDKEVADLFNRMDVLVVPETATFALIRDHIEAHCKTKRRKIKVLRWMGEASHNYFRSPWTIIALLAAMLGLTLTFIQTWYTIRCKGS